MIAVNLHGPSVLLCAGMVQEPSGKVQAATAAAATAAAPTAAGLPDEGVLEIEPDAEQREQREQRQQREQREQDVDELDGDAQQAFVAGVSAARQGSTGPQLPVARHHVHVPAPRRHPDRRQRRERRPHHAVSSVDPGFQPVTAVVLPASDEPDSSRRVWFHLEFSVAGLGEPEPMLRRADLQRLPEPVHQRRLLSDPDLAYAPQPPGQLPSSPVPSQHDAHLVDVALNQPSSEFNGRQRHRRVALGLRRLHTARPEVPDDGIAAH